MGSGREKLELKSSTNSSQGYLRFFVESILRRGRVGLGAFTTLQNRFHQVRVARSGPGAKAGGWNLARIGILMAAAGLLAVTAHGQVPSLLNYQGRLVVHGTSFDGSGQFKFALVNADASSVYWRNAPDVNADGEPDSAVVLTVSKGIYSVALGDTNLSNMAALPSAVFANPAVFLRVWFNDGVTGSQRLAPDQRITAVGYAMMAANVSDGAITQSKLASDLAAQFNSFTTVSADPQDAALGGLGYQAFMTVAAPAWVNGATTGAPGARSGHSAVWSGQELLVWGGDPGTGIPTASGGRYQPVTDQWQALSPLNAPSARSGHSAVWTGSQMIIWGGGASGGFATGGGLFDPVSGNWSSVSTVNAPAGRQGQVAAWNGSKLIVWGGQNSTGLLADGGLFDPVAGQWTTLTATSPPEARSGATAVWTGSSFMVWGGQGAGSALNTGAQLLFNAGAPQSAWQSLAASGAPSARTGHTAVWTGQKMIVWGGSNGGVFAGDGAAYDPVAQTWSGLSSTNAPSARSGHDAVWTGAEMIVFGGMNASGVLADGAAYNPVTDKWRPLTNPGAPVARSAATAVWSGTEVLIFGGLAGSQPLAALQRLNPQPAWYLYRKP